jgi:hypothetical protein
MQQVFLLAACESTVTISDDLLRRAEQLAAEISG